MKTRGEGMRYTLERTLDSPYYTMRVKRVVVFEGDSGTISQSIPVSLECVHAPGGVDRLLELERRLNAGIDRRVADAEQRANRGIDTGGFIVGDFIKVGHEDPS